MSLYKKQKINEINGTSFLGVLLIVTQFGRYILTKFFHKIGSNLPVINILFKITVLGREQTAKG
jgi:hypothetical protein